jgi:hypothetical protein
MRKWLFPFLLLTLAGCDALPPLPNFPNEGRSEIPLGLSLQQGTECPDRPRWLPPYSEFVGRVVELTNSQYGRLTLFYSPRNAQAFIKEFRYTQNCSRVDDETALLNCLWKAPDYSQTPERRDIDNPSLHLDRGRKEIIESILLNDIPIREASEDRKVVYHYEYEIRIEADGYHPLYFFITGDRQRPKNEEGWQTLFWDQKGPGLFMADFQGADLRPTAETAKGNYRSALIAVECIRREIAAKRKEGKNITDDTVQGLYLELLNRNGFKTFEEFNLIDQELRKDEEVFGALQKEIAAAVCR